MRLPFLRFDGSLQRGWSLPLLLPILVAAAMVLTLAVQAARTVSAHRAAVANTLQDYTAFAAWQYARRSSDYLRLTIMNAVERDGPLLSAHIDPDGTIRLERNRTDASPDAARALVARAARTLRRTDPPIGMIPLDADRRRYLAFQLPTKGNGERRFDGVVFTEAELHPVFTHVAEFAPLLPPSLVGGVPGDSIVGVEVRDARGGVIDRIGPATQGPIASERLGDALGGLTIRATLTPHAAARLTAGRVVATDPALLTTMLVVTAVLCGIAVLQVRRTAQLVRLRSDFVASVSHELRTPLAQISLFAETLARPRERDPAERQEYARIIAREARRLRSLVDGILYFSGMSRTVRAPVAAEPIDILAETRHTVGAFAPLAEAQGAALALDATAFEEARPAVVLVRVDRDGFRQLLLNLLDNALKFGPEHGTIRISLRIESREDVSIVILRVDDDGPGVAPRDRERIFDPFVRVAGESGGRAPAGSGIGLAVVRDIVHRNGGRVQFTAHESQGGRVQVEFPCERHTVAFAA